MRMQSVAVRRVTAVLSSNGASSATTSAVIIAISVLMSHDWTPGVTRPVHFLLLCALLLLLRAHSTQVQRRVVPLWGYNRRRVFLFLRNIVVQMSSVLFNRVVVAIVHARAREQGRIRPTQIYK